MNDRLLKIWNDPRRAPILIGLIAFNAGIGLGYNLAKRRLENQKAKNISELYNKGLYEVKTKSYNTTTEDIPDEIVISNKVMSAKDFVIEPIKLDEPAELVTRSIFDHNENWDYEVEKKKRTTEKPYVLHRDEFFAEENDYIQSTLTYYDGDNILVDEDDTPIYNYNQVVGELLFGHGSGDPNVVYVRNDKRKAEYEVVFDKGLYSVEVLGLEIEQNEKVKDLRHSKIPRFRQE